MPDNEEDYLNQLLASMNEKENADNEIDLEEQLIKEQVEEAVNKSNLQEANEELDDGIIIPDEASIEDSLESENIIDNTELESSLLDDLEEIPEDNGEVLNPDDIAKLVNENAEEEITSDTANEEAADAQVEELLNNTDISEAAKAEITSDDGQELSDSDMERLLNMNLDDIIEDVTSESVSVEDLFGYSAADDEINVDVESEPESKATPANNDNHSDISAAEALAAGEVIGEIKKKKGLFSKIKDIFFDSLEDEEEENNTEEKKDKKKKKNKKEKANSENTDNANKTDSSEENNQTSDAVDDNEQLIDEVFQGKETLEDMEAPKKGFFAKFKYRLAQMKAKRAEEERLEEEAEALEEEEKQKAKALKKEEAAKKKEEKEKAKKEAPKKEKKPKKEKPKKEKKPKPEPKPGDILKIKPMSMVMFVLFVAGVIVLIFMLNKSTYYDNTLSQARLYYNNGNYSKAYSTLDGLDLKDNDKIFYEQVSAIMVVERQYDSFTNLLKVDMYTEALNSLIKGVDRYHEYYDKGEELGVQEKMDVSYQKILQALQDTYKISEREALSLVELSKEDFTNYYFKIEDYGEAYYDSNNRL